MTGPTISPVLYLNKLYMAAADLALNHSIGHLQQRFLLHHSPDAWLQYRAAVYHQSPDLSDVQVAVTLHERLRLRPDWDDRGTCGDLLDLLRLADAQLRAIPQGVGQAQFTLPAYQVRLDQWDSMVQAPVPEPEVPGKWDRDHWHPEIV